MCGYVYIHSYFCFCCYDKMYMYTCIYVFVCAFVCMCTRIPNTMMKSNLGKKRIFQLKISGFSTVHHCGAVKAEPEADWNTHGQGQGEPDASQSTAQPTFSILTV